MGSGEVTAAKERGVEEAENADRGRTDDKVGERNEHDLNIEDAEDEVEGEKKKGEDQEAEKGNPLGDLEGGKAE